MTAPASQLTTAYVAIGAMEELDDAGGDLGAFEDHGDEVAFIQAVISSVGIGELESRGASMAARIYCHELCERYGRVIGRRLLESGPLHDQQVRELTEDVIVTAKAIFRL